MSTLLLRFAAPMQSWGSSSRFQTRDTSREPTKSAVIGMLGAALGKRRNEPIDDCARFNFGVRIDQPGRLLNDFQTARTLDNRQTFVSNRRYLSDAVFVVGIEDDIEKLIEYENAIKHPIFPLFLGRRSCPPAQPLVLGIRENTSLLEALQNEPWQASALYQKKQHSQQQVSLEIVIDTQFGVPSSYTQDDLPLSFDQNHRIYKSRSVMRILAGATIDNQEATEAINTTTSHDAITALEGK
ncbi:MAG: type I-E CRISPR-associated protein Cas5/CasD [Coriobacteriia bacterium]|nr:type I-E CRISPR-associated protein Cas5/CasD [Coriobacteriia bacterium]